MINRESVIHMLVGYLNGQVSLERLVDWAEDALCEGNVEARHAEAVSAALARLGLADVRAFGLNWEDTQAILASLGYHAQVVAVPA
jgi:hypothetical protein